MNWANEQGKYLCADEDGIFVTTPGNIDELAALPERGLSNWTRTRRSAITLPTMLDSSHW
jgi:hypothetical protein